MNKQVKEKIDSLMLTSKTFTENYASQIRLAIWVALSCCGEAYKSSSLESSRIDLWEDVVDELTGMLKEAE